MNENDYDQLFQQLYKLQLEAPCHNGGCVGYQICEYGVNACYGEKCAIQIVQEVAEQQYEYEKIKANKNELII